MNPVLPPMLSLLSVLLMSGKAYSEDAGPILEGPYLGQMPPGSTPEVFAPGIVSTKGWEYGVVFTPDMKELYFSQRG